MAKITIEAGEIPESQEPLWWGVTVGALAYAVFAPNKDRAIELTREAIGIPREHGAIVIYHNHKKDAQRELTEKFGATERAIRVIPFSSNPWLTK